MTEDQRNHGRNDHHGEILPNFHLWKRPFGDQTDGGCEALTRHHDGLGVNFKVNTKRKDHNTDQRCNELSPVGCQWQPLIEANEPINENAEEKTGNQLYDIAPSEATFQNQFFQ